MGRLDFFRRGGLPRIRTALLGLFGEAEAPLVIPPESAGWVRARQVATYQRYSLVIVIANLMNAGLMAALMYSSPLRWIVVTWTLAITGLMLVFLYQWAKRLKQPARETRSAGSINRAVRDTAVLGAVWGALPALCFASSPPEIQTIIATVVVGMMCGAAFIMLSIPRAGFSFIGLLALGGFIGLLSDPTPLHLFLCALFVVYIATMIFSVHRTFGEFVGRLLGERLAREQTDLIGMLLRDFEQAASDWLWTTDASGRLESGAARFCPSGQPPATLLEGFEANADTYELAAMMREQDSFSHLVVRSTSHCGHSWLSLTGKPIYRNGEFCGYQGVAADITAERESADRIAHLAAHDSLTGLANRETFRATLQEMLNYTDSRREAGCLLLIDLDRFKIINDTLGHAAGDSVLIEVAKRVRGIIRTAGVVCRMGGDEFAVAINQPGGDPVLLARQIIDAIERPYPFDGAVAKCSASIGLRRVAREDDDLEILVRQADLALYRAKAQGRGHVVEFDWTMDLEAQELMLLEHDLRSAIAGEQLHLVYQPLAGASTGIIAGCEALLRWEHPRLGNIAPDRFIDLAERSGLIVPVGEWVIRSAIAAAAQIHPGIRVAINVSPMQLRSNNLCSVFVNALAANGVAAERIEVEITESVLLADTEANLAVLQQLRALGLRISMDDFGTGYSSFSYLRKFDFDKLKIDKSFIDCLGKEDSSDAIVGAIIALARVLGMRTVAEGVETGSQLAALSALGCDEAQGYLFSRPVRLDALIDMVGAAPALPAERLVPLADGPVVDIAQQRAS